MPRPPQQAPVTPNPRRAKWRRQGPSPQPQPSLLSVAAPWREHSLAMQAPPPPLPQRRMLLPLLLAVPQKLSRRVVQPRMVLPCRAPSPRKGHLQGLPLRALRVRSGGIVVGGSIAREWKRCGLLPTVRTLRILLLLLGVVRQGWPVQMALPMTTKMASRLPALWQKRHLSHRRTRRTPGPRVLPRRRRRKRRMLLPALGPLPLQRPPRLQLCQ